MTPVQTINTDTSSPQSLADWYERHKKIVGVAAAVVLVAVAGGWFYMRSAEIKRTNAERMLNQARQSIGAGNIPLAMTDLQRVATRYQGTPAGVQAAMLLAQMNYDQGKFAEGLQALEPFKAKAPVNQSAVWDLIADGNLAQGKLDEAVAAYRGAADAAGGPAERAFFLAKAGRVLMTAGKNAEARAIWQELSDDPAAGAVHSEAEVRLGELTAQPAGRS